MDKPLVEPLIYYFKCNRGPTTILVIDGPLCRHIRQTAARLAMVERLSHGHGTALGETNKIIESLKFLNQCLGLHLIWRMFRVVCVWFGFLLCHLVGSHSRTVQSRDEQTS